jgi:hypothetical protein
MYQFSNLIKLRYVEQVDDEIQNEKVRKIKRKIEN